MRPKCETIIKINSKPKEEIHLLELLFSQLKNFTFSVLEVELLMEEEAVLPPFKGSMFRGGLAWGVRKASCTENHKSCPGCIRLGECAYSYLFESSHKAAGQQTIEIPRPYLIQLVDNGRRNYRAGEVLRFRIVLFGEATKMLAFILLGLKHFTRLGLGAGRKAFTLQQVTTVNLLSEEKRSVYIPPDGYFDNTIILSGADLMKDLPFDFSAVHIKRIELEFLTPTRLVEKGTLISRPSFESIARAALRRISSLMYYYCNGNLNVDFKTLVLAAEKIELEKDDLQWVELKRYSNRQKEHIFISGFLGRAEYKGELKELFPYLYTARFCHIGKGTVYGLGAYNIKFVM